MYTRASAQILLKFELEMWTVSLIKLVYVQSSNFIKSTLTIYLVLDHGGSRQFSLRRESPYQILLDVVANPCIPHPPMGWGDIHTRPPMGGAYNICACA